MQVFSIKPISTVPEGLENHTELKKIVLYTKMIFILTTNLLYHKGFEFKNSSSRTLTLRDVLSGITGLSPLYV